jgi:hypothetical protein
MSDGVEDLRCLRCGELLDPYVDNVAQVGSGYVHVSPDTCIVRLQHRIKIVSMGLPKGSKDDRLPAVCKD